MSLSLYRAFGPRAGYDYVRTEYVEGAIKFYLAAREDQLVCPDCGSWDICRKGKRFREVPSAPFGSKPVILVAEIPRCQCRDCGKLFEVSLAEATQAPLTG